MLEGLGKIRVLDIPQEKVVMRFTHHLNDSDLPMTFVALDGKILVGMCSFHANYSIREDLTSWLGFLVLETKYQKQGIGKMLSDVVINQAKEHEFEKNYI